jgi:hypothetical protein
VAVVAELEPISLEELDERSALRRRVDTKYVVPGERLADLIEEISDSYAVLEIDGHRRFSYESVYFDTPDLRCFHDHVNGVRPRFKARTRLYQETGACFFEVKVRQEDDMVKRQLPYDRADHGSLTPEARRFVEEVLGDAAPDDLAPSLSTTYDRITLGAKAGGERVTTDLSVELRTMDDQSVRLRDELTLVETKSGEGGGGVDELLRAEGCEPLSISKYRLGVGLLLADDPEAARAQQLRNCFA